MDLKRIAREVEKAALYGDDLLPMSPTGLGWLISNGLDAGVQEARDLMSDILDPVPFWCRFCRVTLEGTL